MSKKINLVLAVCLIIALLLAVTFGVICYLKSVENPSIANNGNQTEDVYYKDEENITIKPSKQFSETFSNFEEIRNYITSNWNENKNEAASFYENIDGVGIGDDIWSGLVCNYKASSTYSDAKTDHSANNLNEILIDKCWAEGKDSYGIGETIEVNAFASSEKVTYGDSSRKYDSQEDVIDYLLTDFNDEIDAKGINCEKITEENISNYYNEIKQIAIINGYAKNDELWKNNSRIKKLKVTVDDKNEFILELEDNKNVQLFDIYYKNNCIKNEINLKFEILEIYPGDKYDDTCLTSLHLVGGSNVNWGGR